MARRGGVSRLANSGRGHGSRMVFQAVCDAGVRTSGARSMAGKPLPGKDWCAGREEAGQLPDVFDDAGSRQGTDRRAPIPDGAGPPDPHRMPSLLSPIEGRFISDFFPDIER